MKLLLVLLCLLLCGCAERTPETETEVPAITASTVPETEPVSMYDADNPLEEAHRGALRVYPLTMRKVQGIRAMEDDILVFSGYGSTTLTLLTGHELFVAAEVTLDFTLDPNDPSVQTGNGTLSYFDTATQETVVLNEMLKEVSRIAVTEPLCGSPLLSSDRNTLFYCTPDAIRAWNLETGIHRTVKELAYDGQNLTGLHLNDTVLQCRIQDGGTVRTLFLASDTGRLLSQQEGEVSLKTDGGRYYAALPASCLELLVFGDVGGAPRMLYPDDLAAENFYLPEDHAAVTASLTADGTVKLDFYDLDSGIRQAELSLPELQNPKNILEVTGNSVYILVYDPEKDCDTIYRWEIPANASDTKVYTDTYVTKENANYDALAQCRTYAAEIGSKYGIEIRVGEDALAVQPWDYEFQAEYLHRVLKQELTLLDQRLSKFPAGMLEKTVSHFTGLKLCLVRQITGTAESGSLDIATGIQFLDGTDAYVVISVGKYSEQALYHELFHVMETHILDESIALDQWNDLNPSGFEYHYGYSTVQDSEYLAGENRAFVDAYSMSFPKEDRARILENAILPGNEELFHSPILQAKLSKLCEGIREAFGLRKSTETFVWEQYLILVPD